MRHRAVAADALDRHFRRVDSCHHSTGLELHLPGCGARPVVEGKHRIAGKAMEQSLLDHPLRPAYIFLRGLEYQMHRALEVARLGKVAGGA